ncbi:unnamed protein product [Mytilus edulis]|uniref:MEGF10_11 n=1 Tax=Mytilus edulis TaxID=6550 RepID=A0A8S3ULM5_MYTED|nr:unnamed protein product [Mytilus edulis]
MGVYSVFFIYLLYLLLNQGRTEGVCSRLESASTNGRSFYFKKTFCCDNYEMKEDKTCKACKIGFTSKAGLGCTACKGETYGLKCAEKCECNLFERCDRFHGCVSTSNSTVVTYGTQHVNVNYVTGMPLSKIRGNHLGDVKDYTTIEIKQMTVEIQTQHSINEDHLIQDLIRRQLFTFSIGVGSVLVILILVITLSFVCWKRRLKRKHSLNTSEPGIQLTQQSHVREESNQIQDEEHDYIDIEDENILLESLSNSTYDSKRSSGNQVVTNGGTDSEGYLHPYHSLVTIEVTRQNEIDIEKCLAEKQHYFALNTHDSKISSNSLTVLETTSNEESCLELNDVPNNVNAAANDSL